MVNAWWDKKADAILVKLADKDVIYTKRVGETRLMDYAEGNVVVSVGFLEVSKGVDVSDLSRKREIKQALAQWAEIKILEPT